MHYKLIKKIFKTILLISLFYIITYYINSNITIKALYKDDLSSWSWFPGLNFYDFAIKFYDSATRYRPVFYALEYIEFLLVRNHVKYFTFINILLNSIITTFVYVFAKKNTKSNSVAFLISLCYIFSHFSYYQITQVIGILESYSQLFALLILYLCIIYLVNNNKNIIKLSLIYILYFLVSFTHERYMFIAVPILITIIFKRIMNNTNFKQTLIKSFLFLIEIAIIVYIRILSTGKFIPSGTGGTEVHETFNILEALSFAINQVLFIFGINIGPEHLVGISFTNLSIISKIIILLSIIMLLSIIGIYIITKINYIKKNKNTNLIYYIYKDLLYLAFITLAIGSSSVTIRVEMRFIYTSFTISMIYLSYMIGEIFNYTNKSEYKLFSNNIFNKEIFINLKKHIVKNKTIFIVLILFLSFFFTRTCAELIYRKYYPKIHCITDLLRVNSLADLTVNKYGIDELKKKNVYILYNYYEWTDFYREYFFKIYDKTYEGLTIVNLLDIKDIPKNLDKNNDILLLEDVMNNGYIDITDLFIQKSNY